MNIEMPVLGIGMQWFRNGKLLGQSTRDMMIVVIKCPSLVAPTLSGLDCSDPNPENFTAIACPNDSLNFSICSRDPNTQDSVTLTVEHNIPGAQINIIDTSKHQSAQFLWVPKASDISSSPYKMLVTATDNSCASERVVRTYYIRIRPQPDIETRAYQNSCSDALYTVSDLKRVPVNTFFWRVDGKLDFSQRAITDTLVLRFRSIDQWIHYSVRAIVSDQCFDEKSDSVWIKPIPSLVLDKQDTAIMWGESVDLVADTFNTGGESAIYWSTGDSAVTSITVKNIQKDTFFVAHVSDQFNCTASDTCRVDVVNSSAVAELGRFKVYPIPNSGLVHVELSKETRIESLDIYDLKGRAILKLRNPESQFSLRELKSGSYLMQFHLETTGGVRYSIRKLMFMR